MPMNIDFTKEEIKDLLYAAREAQIRFTRERSRLRAGETDTRGRQWEEAELNEEIAKWERIEEV